MPGRRRVVRRKSVITTGALRRGSGVGSTVRGSRYGLGWSSLHPKNWGWKTKAAAGIPLALGAAALSPVWGAALGAGALYHAAGQYIDHKREIDEEAARKKAHDDWEFGTPYKLSGREEMLRRAYKIRRQNEEYHERMAEQRADEEIKRKQDAERKADKIWCYANRSKCNGFVPKGGIGKRYGLGWSSLRPENWGWKTRAVANLPLVALGTVANPLIGAFLAADAVGDATEGYREQKRKQRAEAERRAKQEALEIELEERRRQKEIDRMLKEQSSIEALDEDNIEMTMRGKGAYCLAHPSKCRRVK